MAGGMPIIVLNQNTKRESGRKVQLGNIEAGKTVADVIRTCLGPRSMLKMLMDPMGGIVMTNDGNAILRELNVKHPAAKSMIEVARTQDEETGDGTKSVIILAGEVLSVAEQFIHQQMHPTIIIAAYRQALEDIISDLKNKIATPVDVSNREEMIKIIKSCLGTKFISKWMDLACAIALDATATVAIEENNKREIDIKRYAKVEKIPGGLLEDSKVLKGVMINKDVTHPKMRRRIENPRILLLDCNMEYKKGESVTNIEITQEADFSKILKLEEEYIEKICNEVIALRPDLVITEKGVSDLAQHYLVKANISVLRRVRKSDNNRIARACGATIANRTDELKEEDIGTQCGLFEIQKIGDDEKLMVTDAPLKSMSNALHITSCKLAALIIVIGAAWPCLGIRGAVAALNDRAKSITGIHQWPYRAISRALEIIPRTLIQNCGANPIRTLTAIRAKHALANNTTWGIDGTTGQIVDMKSFGVWEPLSVKQQVYKTAIETAILLLRIDDIVSGVKKQDALNAPSSGPQEAPQASEGPEP
ncbi:T-complex protein 1 subunit gamma [Plakobranchus ocellatus]|uniref:T-complex protein 1 subunit gamma n=1 Tax=Plakobranchus ocellatus TaxID=259542 RepID=A0AAV3Z615_9GAST|nr:T-complex protein 1 subunit gamma [Plakobranchus ocellatus]